MSDEIKAKAAPGGSNHVRYVNVDPSGFGMWSFFIVLTVLCFKSCGVSLW